jgi:FemAB-related protein (PEP-CTERM system-associated)
MEIVALTEDLEAEWAAYVSGRPALSAAHLLGWRNAVRRAYGHLPCHLVAREGGKVVGVLPLFLVRHPMFGRSLVTAPFLSHGGLSADGAEAARALIDSARDVRRQWRARYVEFRSLEPRGYGLRLKEKYCAHLLRLDADPDVVWRRCENRARTATRKASRLDLAVERGSHLLNSFTAVVTRQMRDLGTPFHGPGFYRAIVGELPEHVEIFTVRQGGDVLGGGLAVRSGDTLHWVYGGCLRSSRGLAAMNLLTWEIIRFGCLEKMSWLDFGRSRWDSGAALFKRQWGARAVPLFYEYDLADGLRVPDMDPTNPRFRLAIAIWRRLPVWLAAQVGPALIRGIP